jgi:hypothetical protein
MPRDGAILLRDLIGKLDALDTQPAKVDTKVLTRQRRNWP